MHETGEERGTFAQRMRRFITQCARVLKITKKPDRQEYSMLVKVSGLGIAAIGLIGFLLFLIKSLLFTF